ncbi:putative nuclease of predicted toxin-antitoxin system [Roseivirga pacifica]|uniref:Predicted nuclease, contains PIN domain, potential toxin-antitoxin system component n=1 Tax=Roseivirga pacifica TaxID=1267423 RepID=A0A1I0NB02_9BACT|nr:DUF5615 family PIN-like protein [Roseivirga pacifica]RKQ51039.1 putative nuclease of predicted toxin-antitoxin system [Roseivirga pacifica]SEV98102.1 Predicted nuclease, contains PIN domain, potential toxin-antitoxin system component [Roseivirga pacifica]
MRVLIDAQLPQLLKEILASIGIEATHVIELPKGDTTPDSEIQAYADENDLMLITKDSDFYYSHITLSKPKRLFLITTGNTKNRKLFDLFRDNSLIIAQAVKRSSFLELNNEGIIERD